MKRASAYPKGERVWVSYRDGGGVLRFLLTSKENSRDYYYLYECVDGEFRKLGRSRSPSDLEEQFDVGSKIGVKESG